MTKLYLYQNQYRTWDYLHNRVGFTTTPSTTISYLYANAVNWGVGFTYGYYSGDTLDPSSGEYYVATVYVGWRGIDALATNLGLMPSIGGNIDTTLTFTDGFQSSPAAKIITKQDTGGLELQDVPIYLIQAAINQGWHTESEWEDLGWTQGRDDVIPMGGIITSTSDHTDYLDKPELLENGGIFFTGSLTPATIPPSGVVNEYVLIPLLGVLTSTTDKAIKLHDLLCGVLEEDRVNTIDVLFGMYWNRINDEWLSYTFTQNNPFYANLINQNDVNAITSIGLTMTRGGSYVNSPVGLAVDWSNNYTFEPLGVYSDIEGTQLLPDDMNDYVCDSSNGLLCIKRTVSGYGSSAKSWKCRITRI